MHLHPSRAHQQQQQQQGSSSMSSSTSSSTNSNSAFELLETRHHHHLARHQRRLWDLPPGHLSMSSRTGTNTMGVGDIDHVHKPQQQHQRHLEDTSFVNQELQNDQLVNEKPNAEEEQPLSSSSSSLSDNNFNDVVDGAAGNVVNNLQQKSMEGRLRATLLKNYDKNSFPWDWAWEQNYEIVDFDREGDQQNNNRTFNENNNNTTTSNRSNTDASNQLRQGLPVEFGLNFHKGTFVCDMI